MNDAMTKLFKFEKSDNGNMTIDFGARIYIFWEN